jgi:hypothetical protein
MRMQYFDQKSSFTGGKRMVGSAAKTIRVMKRAALTQSALRHFPSQAAKG